MVGIDGSSSLRPTRSQVDLEKREKRDHSAGRGGSYPLRPQAPRSQAGGEYLALDAGCWLLTPPESACSDHTSSADRVRDPSICAGLCRRRRDLSRRTGFGLIDLSRCWVLRRLREERSQSEHWVLRCDLSKRWVLSTDVISVGALGSKRS